MTEQKFRQLKAWVGSLFARGQITEEVMNRHNLVLTNMYYYGTWEGTEILKNILNPKEIKECQHGQTKTLI